MSDANEPVALAKGFRRIVGDGSAAYIAHDPEGYPGPKADARKIRAREGKSARLEYVAWPTSNET